MAGKVAVVGAGSSGIAVTKVMADAGFTDVVCFERRDTLGGLWYFSEHQARWSDESSVNRSTVINSSKEFSAFSDYPMPDDFPNFCHNKKMKEYFCSYAKHFGVDKKIRYNSEVISVMKHSTFESTGRWEVKTRDHKTGEEVTEIYDFVLLANGHHGEVNLPHYAGLETFKGKTMHSRDYKDVFGYQGKRACVVGIGNSGGDITSELSKYCQVFLSTRRGVWIMHRLGPSGLPLDYYFHIRFSNWLKSMMPRWLSNYLWKKELSTRIDHKLFGLQSMCEPDSTHPTVNDELPNRIACGMVKVKPNISRFTENGIVFDDGSFEDNIDLVVFATGYKVGYHFLDQSVLGEIKDNRLELYKHMWVPDLVPNTLAIIAAVQPLGCMFPIAELQGRLAARVFKGEVRLPSPTEMRKDFDAHDAVLKNRYIQTPRHTFQVDWLPYMDELAVLTGCKPNLVWILLTDPVLFWSLMFGPSSPYQYRLHGPNAWPGARKAQLTVMDRIRRPLATRTLPESSSSTDRSWLWSVTLLGILSAGGLAAIGRYLPLEHTKLWCWTLMQSVGLRK